MESFLTVDNMRLCIEVFSNYMKDKYRFDILKDGKDTNVKKVMYEVMKEIDGEYGSTMSLKDKNNVVLNIARDRYKAMYKLNKVAPPGPSSKVNVRSLERDSQVYGQRPVNTVQLKPTFTQERARSTETEYKQLEDTRKREAAERVQPKFDDPLTEDAFRPDDFNKRIADLTKMRGDVSMPSDARFIQDSEMVKRAVTDVNPKDMYLPPVDAAATATTATTATTPATTVVQRKEFVTSPTSRVYTQERYFCVNGFDRNWNIAKKRFHFTTDFSANDNSIQQRYRNVKSLAVKRIIIPQEIKELSSINNVPKNMYNHSFGFSFPYIFLQIDEIDNVYDGTNDTVRKGFTQMIVDKCYYAPNGRGYLVLQSIQDEKKVFQTPLSELSKLTISLRKPNGELFNDSVDDLKIFKVEYELLNKQYLKIVTNKYFDKNEFYKGDTIVIQGYTMPKLTNAMTDSGIRKFTEFINRKSGHDVVELGQANDSGFYRNFYIKAPGAFDDSCGKFVVDADVIACLEAYNNAYDFVANPATTNGSFLNMALQCIFTFKIEQVLPDPGRMELTAS